MFRLFPLLFLAWISACWAQDNPSGTQLWYNVHVTPTNDWRQVFQDDSGWPLGASRISVLTMGQDWIHLAALSDVLLETNFAARYHKQLNMEAMVVVKNPSESCGVGEGYSFMSDIEASLQVLQANNIQLDWIQMDEPLWFGHYDSEAGKCQYSVSDTAARSAQFLLAVLAVYPHIHIVETEPVPALTSEPDWRQTLTQFRLELERRINRRINVMHLDVYWIAPGWQQGVQDLDAYLRENNMTWGVYIDATGASVGGLAWNAQAVANFNLLEGTMHLLPSQAIFASWYPDPVNNLPETDPTVLTWLIGQYDRERTSLDVHFKGAGAYGQLTTLLGKPIPSATIQPMVPGSDLTQPLPVQTETGTVPAGAVQGIFALRLNAECGNCSGINDVLLGGMTYQETAGGTDTANASIPTNTVVYGGGTTFTGLPVGGSVVSRLMCAPGQPIYWQTPTFPVTPGATFQFSVPAGSVGGLGWHGNVGIIFLGTAGEVSRSMMQPDAGTTHLPVVATDWKGRFTIPRLPRAALGLEPATVYYDGGGVYRATTWTAGQ